MCVCTPKKRTPWCRNCKPTLAPDHPHSTKSNAPVRVDLYETLREANLARGEEWQGDLKLPASFWSTELAGEVGEACNVVKKLERERYGLRGSRDTVDHLAEELANVIICVDLLAIHYGINMDDAVARKFNATSEKVGLKTRLVK